MTDTLAVDSAMGLIVTAGWIGVRRVDAKKRVRRWQELRERLLWMHSVRPLTLPELLVLSSGVHAGSSLASITMEAK